MSSITVNELLRSSDIWLCSECHKLYRGQHIEFRGGIHCIHCHKDIDFYPCVVCSKPSAHTITANKVIIPFCSRPCGKIYSKQKGYKSACVCGKNSTLRCGRCKIVPYCSRECQRADWDEHKKLCHE